MYSLVMDSLVMESLVMDSLVMESQVIDSLHGCNCDGNLHEVRGGPR